MTTHAAILAELEKYEGGMFRPHSPTQAYDGEASGEERWHLRVRDDGIFVWTFGPLAEQVLTHDAHAHIERSAFMAVRHWCEMHFWDLAVSYPCEHVGVNAYGVKYVEYSSGTQFIASAPDEPAMWLAAMKYINGEKA